jgi:glycosyltransferase domain-containing protein
MIDLSDLTIIIPSYNRHDYVIRNMSFWSSTNATVHVLDGSDNKLEKHISYNFSPNIHYHHYPVSFAERISKASALINTKYAVLLGDDDMFLKTGLRSCIDELENNNQIISCIGRTMSFYCNNEILFGDLEYKEMENYEVSCNDPFQRMIFHMNPYCCSILYSVTRSDHWKKAASLVSLSVFPDPGLVELQFELAICFLGKSKVIPNLMWMRSYENPSLYDGKQISFHNWWHDINYTHLKNNLISNFSKTLNYENLYQDEYFKNKTDEAYSAYVEWAKKYTSKLDLVDNIVIRLKQLLVKIKNRILTKSLKTKMIKFKDQGIIVNSEEVDSFIFFILKFYKKNGI